MGAALAIGAVLVTVPPAAAQDADAVIGRAAKVYRALGSLRASFVQQIENPMVDVPESRGTLIQAGPSKLSMRFTDPKGEAIVIDGEYVWVYTPSTTPGQVIRIPVPSGGPAYGYNLLAWFLDRPTERYDAKYLRQDRINGTAVDVVELVPAVPDLPFTRAVIWLGRDDALPRRLEIEERSGSKRTLTLSDLRTNQPVPDSTFEFEVPKGVRIIDR